MVGSLKIPVSQIETNEWACRTVERGRVDVGEGNGRGFESLFHPRVRGEGGGGYVKYHRKYKI